MKTLPPVISSELKTALKKLKLGHIIMALPERMVLAEKQNLSFEESLLLVLSEKSLDAKAPHARDVQPKLGWIRRRTNSNGRGPNQRRGSELRRAASYATAARREIVRRPR